MICPPSPYATLTDSDLCKLQALVSRADKELMMTILPDRGLYTFALATFIQRTADFIRFNELEYNDTDQRRLINFINGNLNFSVNGLREHAAARTPGNPDARDEPGAVEGVREAPKDVANKPAGSGSRRKKG